MRQRLQYVEGHDGRSLSSHCWRMEPATGDWQAWLGRGVVLRLFQQCVDTMDMTLGFISACKYCAKICEVQHMHELEVSFACLCRSGFLWSPSHIRCCHQDGMVWTCYLYEPLVECGIVAASLEALTALTRVSCVLGGGSPPNSSQHGLCCGSGWKVPAVWAQRVPTISVNPHSRQISSQAFGKQ